MGQKVNPHGLRVGVIKNWDSRWFAKDEKFGDTLVSDYKVRKYLKNKLMPAGIPKIEIERDNIGRVRVFIHCAKPGLIIGREGHDIDILRRELETMLASPVSVNVIEVKPVDMCAQLVAESIASSLERRISFRRAMKQAIGRTMRLGAKGIKVAVSGRLGGAEIARREHYHEGTIPLQTLRADIDYGFWEANTTYGKIGVKVWIYKGEILPEVARQAVADNRGSRGERRDGGRGRDGRGRDNRPGRDGRSDRGAGRGPDRRGDGRGGRDGRDGRGGRGGAAPESTSPRMPRQRKTTGGAN